VQLVQLYQSQMGTLYIWNCALCCAVTVLAVCTLKTRTSNVQDTHFLYLKSRKTNVDWGKVKCKMTLTFLKQKEGASPYYLTKYINS
jgi:hypothetical protein